MAFIDRVPPQDIDPADRVPDEDGIIQVHSVHGRVMRQHYDLYVELMHRPSPLSRIQREIVATVVSSLNECEY